MRHISMQFMALCRGMQSLPSSPPSCQPLHLAAAAQVCAAEQQHPSATTINRRHPLALPALVAQAVGGVGVKRGV